MGAAEELRHLITEPRLAAVPIAVLGQKDDLSNAASEEEFRSAMGLSPDRVPDRPVKAFMCSVAERRGYTIAMSWIQEVLEKHISVPSKATPVAVDAAPAAGDSEDEMMV